jgi:6-phosphogluconolactonase/glucosamine-6-phosphate isomerase/deaminase
MRTINAARFVAPFVCGADKHAMLMRVVAGANAGEVPIAGVRPAGELRWYVDGAAVRGS